MTNEERALVWEAHVAEWRASGLSQTMFAQQHGLKEVQLGYWIRRCKALATAPAFLPVGLKTSLEPEVAIKGIHMCVFQTKVATDSKAKWPPIPSQCGHPVQTNPATDSKVKWPPCFESSRLT